MLIKVHNFIQFINEKCYTTTCAHIFSIKGLNLTKFLWPWVTCIQRQKVKCWLLEIVGVGKSFFFFFLFFSFFQVLLRFSNWRSLLKPLKLHPVRPDDDEDVEGNNEAKEAGVDNVIVTVDQVHDDLDEVEQKADDGQHKIGHHQTGLCLPSTVDQHGCNDNVADAENEKDRHHCRRPCPM